MLSQVTQLDPDLFASFLLETDERKEWLKRFNRRVTFLENKVDKLPYTPKLYYVSCKYDSKEKKEKATMAKLKKFYNTIKEVSYEKFDPPSGFADGNGTEDIAEETLVFLTNNNEYYRFTIPIDVMSAGHSGGVEDTHVKDYAFNRENKHLDLDDEIMYFMYSVAMCYYNKYSLFHYEL